jgi:hypothetical protein
MPESLTLRKHITQHASDCMTRALSSERYPLYKRDCPELKDVGFIEFGLLRCISMVDSSHHFLQIADELYGEQRLCPPILIHSNRPDERACSSQSSSKAIKFTMKP